MADQAAVERRERMRVQAAYLMAESYATARDDNPHVTVVDTFITQPRTSDKQHGSADT